MRPIPGDRLLIAALLVFVAAFSMSGCTRSSERDDSEPLRRAVGSSDWTIFRGDPGLTGIVDGEVPDAVALAWEFATGDEIKSSPVVVAGIVYIGSTDGFIYAIDLENGR